MNSKQWRPAFISNPAQKPESDISCCSVCHNGGCHPGQRATQDWWLMRTTLAGSLSQPCHRADTFITMSHSRRSKCQKARHHLLYLRTSTCMQTRTSACAATEELTAAAAGQSQDKGHRSSESFTLTMWLQRGSQATITDAGLVWAPSWDASPCWHFAVDTQREARRPNPSYLAFVLNRLEAGRSAAGKMADWAFWRVSPEQTGEREPRKASLVMVPPNV